jgi:PAT family beta-lactamase induction signal transducer AmpG
VPHPVIDRPRPWRWIPSLYFAQGLPYVVVMTLAVVLYKNLGLNNTEIALYTSWLYLPWVVKPLWSPLVELLGRKRVWIVAMQLVVGAALAALVLALPGPRFLHATLALFWLMAFASATHDIAADGFYMLALPERTQAAFVGVRSLFYRLSMIAGQGGLVVAAGWLAERQGNVLLAWQQVFGVLGVALMAAAAWHALVLPRPAADRAAASAGDRTDPAARNGPGGQAALWRDALQVFAAFFRQPGIGRVLAFLLLYRLAEAQLLKLVTPFMLDAPVAGGLGLKTQDVGIAYGTAGVAALTMGGLLGGWVISRIGLQRALWPMIACLHGPNLLYVALAWVQPQALWLVSAAVAVEQLGYGFGFTAYMVFMLMVAERGTTGHDNPHKTAHYALCTGFMALGMMLPGMAAGWLQQQLGYLGFFAWVCVAALPSLVAAALVRIEPGFGRREAPPEAG